jgi:lipid II:glycine glycyltransferase (peptidoglycan interpeptide bridge formation enzyme)
MFHSVLQTPAWARFKERMGWRPERFANLLILGRQLPFGRSMRYLPELPWNTEILAELPAILANKPKAGELFLRLEFLSPWTDEAALKLKELGLVKSFEEVQPEYRQWVDVRGAEEAILQQMKPKGRYNINLAKRAGLQIRQGVEPQLVEQFHRLYAETASRNRFSARGLSYFQALVAELHKDAHVEVIVIAHNDQPLAAGIFTFYDGLCSYLYGASSSEQRSLMAPYLLHWEAMRLAKVHHCEVYDLLAIAPPDQANHPYSQLTRFKSQFGGEAVRLLGSWDLVQSRFWYTMYRFAERRRRPSVQ